MSSRATKFPTVLMKDVPLSNASMAREPYRPVVLVVDDETVIADSLSDILTRSGYAAIPAYDGEGALEAALLTPPEMLISDVVLPGMTGIELATIVQRMFPDCKVILSSGQSSAARLMDSADCARNQFIFLNKPVHPRDLLAQVAESFQSLTASIGVSAVAGTA